MQSEEGGMDFSKVGEKFLSSVRSARSLGLIPSTTDRPEVPSRAAAAAAAVARVLAGLRPHQRQNLSSSSEELSPIYGSTQQNHTVDDLEDGFYEEVIDAYALIGDVSGLAEKTQSFFMQEVLSQSHSALWKVLEEDVENSVIQTARHILSDIQDHAYPGSIASLKSSDKVNTIKVALESAILVVK